MKKGHMIEPMLFFAVFLLVVT